MKYPSLNNLVKLGKIYKKHTQALKKPHIMGASMLNLTLDRYLYQVKIFNCLKMNQ
jgi:hypothetical protein